MVQTNQALASLLQEKEQILKQLNAAPSLIQTEKLKAQLQAVEASLNTATARLNVCTQKVLVQNAANQNDAARVQEAQRQQWQQQALEDDMEMQAVARNIFAADNEKEGHNAN